MTSKLLWSYRRSDLPWLALTAAAYALVAAIVLRFYSANGLVTIFWPASGISLAALLLGGRKFWVSVFIGSLGTGLWLGITPTDAALIALGSILEPLLGAWLLTRKGDFSLSLESPWDFWRLVYLAGLLSPGVNAVIGTAVLLHSGVIPAGGYWQQLAYWWMGNSLGIVLVVPMILAWRRPIASQHAPAPEALIVFAVAFLIGQIIFLGWFSDLFGPVSRSYWMYLIGSWAAVRLGLKYVLILLLVTTLQALVGIAQGVGYFGADRSGAQMANFWAYTMILATLGISLALVFAERESAMAALRSSEGRYKFLFENMQNGFVRCRMVFENGAPVDWEYLAVNPAFERVTGLRDVIGRRGSEVLPGFRENNREAWQDLIRTAEMGETVSREDYLPALDEHFSVAFYRPAEHEFVVIIENITERKRAEARLRASEERLRLAQEAAGIGSYDYDPIGGTVQWDARMRELWSITSDEAVSYDAFVAGLHPEDRASQETALAAALDPAGDGKYHAEYRLIRGSDGQQRALASTGQAFFDAGRPVRFVGTVLDITERKRLEKESQERRHQMETLLQEQVAAQTAAAIAHEINQPLVAISAYSEVALDTVQSGNVEPDTLLHALRGSVDQAQRAGRTLHELLAFLHKGDAKVASLDISDVIREALAIARDDDRSGFQEVLELAPDLPPVLGNRLQVQKVLVNLLRNGAEAMRERGLGAERACITVRTSVAQNMAQITVRDSGPGLGAEAAKRAFDPFFSTKAGGMGLGLAISRALVEAHGGQLWLDAEAGPGATFHFTLPFAP